MMKKNALKEKLASREPVYGVQVTFPDAELVEMLGLAGFDWVLIDAEHGSINENDCLAMVRACELTGITSIVRPPNARSDTILRFLDRGVQGVQVPRVNTAAEARGVVEAVKYLPAGRRGLMGATRAARYGFGESVPEYIKRANAETLVCIMLEEQEALSNLDDILKVDGIDVFFIGAGDLSLEKGFPGDKNAEPVQHAVRGALARIVAADKVAGLSCDDKDIKAFVAMGALYFHTGMTPLIKSAVRQFWDSVGEKRA
jgi:2-keto-3-deoxy-L-rhamnonate aldolase RhmA